MSRNTIVVLIYCHVYGWLKTGFELVIGFIGYLQDVTSYTRNYYTIAVLHNVKPLHTSLFSVSALVFTGL
jgi:hypothetical protein